MTVIYILIALIVGWAGGYISNSFITGNKRDEELAEAYEHGKEYERMRITQAIEDRFGCSISDNCE